MKQANQWPFGAQALDPRCERGIRALMEMITTTDALERACAALATQDFIAVDTEFMRESTYWPQLCLIQIAGAESEEVLIDPLAEGLDLAAFFALMDNQDVLKVFHAARQDLEIVVHLHGTVPKPLFDSQVAAAAVGLGDTIAYDGLVRALLGQNVDKGARFTDWSRRPLSGKQLTYALMDVTHLRDLFPILQARLKTQGREGWVEEEMAALGRPETFIVEPEDAWKRLKLRKTTNSFTAVLKAAAAWRELEARRRDTPRGRILKDDALYEIATQRPTTPEALGQLRAVPNGFERSRAGKELIDAIGPALANPDAHAPTLNRPPPLPAGIGPVTDLLKVLLRMKADEHQVASRLIATVSDLERIAADDNADVPALTGWRREVFGDAALALKQGRTALRLVGDQVVAEAIDPAGRCA